MEYVYAADFGSRVKIGYSTKVPNRIKQIETAQGEKARDYYYIPADRDIECAIHEILSPERISSEWYAIPFIRAKEILVDANKNPDKYKNTHKKVSKAQQKAVSKYMKENYDEIKVRVDKGRKAEIKAHADIQGESVNAFISRAIVETMERDSTDTQGG